jgi:hypothetical protein
MSLSRRKDVRTTEEFRRDIINRTLKERFLARLFVMEMRYRGHDVVVEETGNKDAGKFTQTSSCDPDYVFTVKGIQYPMDIKNCGISKKATFKVYQLQQYLKYDASILLFIGTGFIDKDPTKLDYDNTQWAVIKPEHITKMLELKPYKDPNFGYKECIRIYAGNFHKYFVLQPLMINEPIKYVSTMDLNE